MAGTKTKNIISSLEEFVEVYYGPPLLLTSDGGPQFAASITSKFLRNYGVHHRLSSVSYARSNGRAELGVKTVKRLMMENTGPNGDLDNDAFQRAMLQYRNTPYRQLVDGAIGARIIRVVARILMDRWADKVTEVLGVNGVII